MASEDEYVINIFLTFGFCFCSDSGFKAGIGSLVTYLNHFNVDFVSAGAAFDLDRHVVPFLFYFFTAARSLALLARGLKTISAACAITGRLVRRRK